jgi:tagaturonate reductase
VNDSQASYLSKVWESGNNSVVVENILKNKDLWDTDLTTLPGFKEAVTAQLERIMAEKPLGESITSL